MILVDSSVWIDYLRGAPGEARGFVRERLGVGLAASEPILMEVLAGVRPGPPATNVERLLHSQSWCPVEPALDYRAAADVFAITRSSGRQPRSVQDCLIAAVALRRGVAVAHRDRDFEHIAAATGLKVLDLR